MADGRTAPRHRCENCSLWSSTDRVWGLCTYPEQTKDPSAQAVYVRRGEEIKARFETEWKFACVAWESFAKAVVA
jgi:hypothetical protein